MSPHFGYIRVSSVDQNTDRQLDGVQIDRVFKENISGKSKNRPVLQECLNHLREGDTLHVHSMDRLARNLKDLQGIVEELTGRGIKVKFHKENLTFTNDTSPMSTLMLQIMGAVAEFERSLIKERQMEGIQKAKEQGKHLGRKPSLNKKQMEELRTMVENGIPKTEIAKHFKVSRQTIYRQIANMEFIVGQRNHIEGITHALMENQETVSNAAGRTYHQNMRKHLDKVGQALMKSQDTLIHALGGEPDHQKNDSNRTGQSNPNWPSKTGNPSGGGRGNNPPRK